VPLTANENHDRRNNHDEESTELCMIFDAAMLSHAKVQINRAMEDMN